MHCQASVDQWQTTIMQHLPHLSKPQATVLALWSVGMVLARSCSLTAVSAMLAAVWRQQETTMRQRLREWYYDAPAKRGSARQALQVEACFAPLLGWIVSWWQGTQLALALDATTLGTCFVVLAISVVYRGCAIPVAWVILPTNQKHPWRGEWLRLLRRLWRVVPPHWTVIVLADRGLYAPWLFRRIVKLGGASLFADQHGRHLSAGGDGWLSTAGDVRAPARDALARLRHRLCPPAPAAGLYLVGVLGAGLQGPVADPDRSGPRGQ